MELSWSEWFEKGRAVVTRQLPMMGRPRHQPNEAMTKGGAPEDIHCKILDRYTGLGLTDDAHFADALV